MLVPDRSSTLIFLPHARHRSFVICIYILLFAAPSMWPIKLHLIGISVIHYSIVPLITSSSITLRRMAQIPLPSSGPCKASVSVPARFRQGVTKRARVSAAGDANHWSGAVLSARLRRSAGENQLLPPCHLHTDEKQKRLGVLVTKHGSFGQPCQDLNFLADCWRLLRTN